MAIQRLTEVRKQDDSPKDSRFTKKRKTGKQESKEAAERRLATRRV